MAPPLQRDVVIRRHAIEAAHAMAGVDQLARDVVPDEARSAVTSISRRWPPDRTPAAIVLCGELLWYHGMPVSGKVRCDTVPGLPAIEGFVSSLRSGVNFSVAVSLKRPLLASVIFVGYLPPCDSHSCCTSELTRAAR